MGETHGLGTGFPLCGCPRSSNTDILLGLFQTPRDILSRRPQRAFAHGTTMVADRARDSGR